MRLIMPFWNRKPEDEEQAVEQSKTGVDTANLSELVLQSIHEGVIVIGPEGNIHLANTSAVAMLGRPIDEILGLNHLSVVDFIDKTGERISEANNPICRALTTGESRETRELDLVAKDSGKNLPVSVIVTPTDHEPNEKPSFVVTFRDIADELKEEHERSEFISTASHEMRTPVASIEGYLGLAMNPTTATVDERGMGYLEKAHEASQHLGRLFQDLLDTTKLDDGQILPKMSPVEVVSLVKHISDAQIPAISEKGLGYQFGSGDGQAQSVGGKHIEQIIYANLDRSFLTEIINNLIENAIKYTPAGWITVNVRADQHNVQITVSDTGIGIAREELTHIFQKFYRVDNRDTREIGGTGLGLYLVKQRVEAMNGRIWAESETGKGTQFIVIFPRISAEEYNQIKFLDENTEKQEKGL